MRAVVLEWDVIDGEILGAVIECPECPCRNGTGCDGTGRLHRPYRLHDRPIDLHADAPVLIQLLDRPASATPA